MLPGLFGVAPAVRGLLLAVLLIVIVQQPVAGVVFVLDGVLIGAGDQDYLAIAGLITLAAFAVAAASRGCHRGRPGRAVARLLRLDGGQVRHPDPARPRQLALAGHRRDPPLTTVASGLDPQWPVAISTTFTTTAAIAITRYTHMASHAEAAAGRHRRGRQHRQPRHPPVLLAHLGGDRLMLASPHRRHTGRAGQPD